MKYAIHQIHITNDIIDLINKDGFGACPEFVAKQGMSMDFEGKKLAGRALAAWREGYYTQVSNIHAESLDGVFKVGNIGPEEKIERLQRMHSVSIGDVIIDENGVKSVVAPCGFESL